MARSENQGVQIWLILTIILLVAVSVFTFIFYRSSSELQKQVETAKATEKAAQDGLRKAVFQVEYLKHMIGWNKLSKEDLAINKNGMGTGDAEWQKMEATFQQDMLVVKSADVPEEQLNYRHFFQLVLTSVKKRNFVVGELTTQIAQAIIDRDKAIQIAKLNEAAEKAASAKSNQELATQRSVWQTTYADTTDQTKKQKVKHDQQVVGRKQDQQKFQIDKTNLEKQLEGAKIAIQNLADRAKDKQEADTFKIADGKVVWVNQRSKMVWINLGRKDGLRRATTFSVYDRDESGVSKPQRKGALEVLRIINDHSAEARITESYSSNPILPQDKIYTPAWRPGRKVHFAIAGLIDVTGNGKSDRGMVRSLIRQSSGVIDYELDMSGKQIGTGKAMTVNTRFLVVGTAPADVPGSTQAAIGGYSDAIKQAQQMGIERISVDKLLSYMGWTGNVQITGLGVRASANYKGKRTGQTQKSMGTNAFRKDAPRTTVPRR